MDVNGVLGSLNFPSMTGFTRPALHHDATTRTSRIELLRAYNDWHVEDWCGTLPGPHDPAGRPADLGPRS